MRQKTASPVPTKCTTCNLRTMCGMCPANGELENGDPEAPVDFLCQVAHLRAATYDVPVLPHGDCEYCQDGSRHGELRAMYNDVQDRIAAGPELTPAAMIPASTGCSSGGCNSCSVGR